MGLNTPSNEYFADEQVKLSKMAFSHLIFNPVKRFDQIMQHCKSVYNAVVFINHMSQNVKMKINAIFKGKTM
jgi:hypothetical protein